MLAQTSTARTLNGLTWNEDLEIWVYPERDERHLGTVSQTRPSHDSWLLKDVSDEIRNQDEIQFMDGVLCELRNGTRPNLCEDFEDADEPIGYFESVFPFRY